MAFAFILPSLLMVLGLAALYLRYGGLAWMQGVFYGVGAAVIAIIARSAWKLAKSTLGSKRLAWTAASSHRGCDGVDRIGDRLAVHRRGSSLRLPPVRRFTRRASPTLSLLAATRSRGSGHGPERAGAGRPRLVRIFFYFAEAGAFVFGSGLAIVPFLHGGVVNQFHWLNERQFLDAVAVAMITPGPVVITVAFIGYLVAGPFGRPERRVGCVPALLPIRDRPRSLLHADREESLDRRLRRRGYSGGHGSHRGSSDCPRAAGPSRTCPRS